MSEDKLYDIDSFLKDAGALGNEDLKKSLIKIFIDTSKEYLKNLRTEIDNKDLDGVKATAHALKSSLKQFQINHLLETIINIEDIGKSGKFTNDLPLLIDHLEKEMNKVMAQLNNELNDV